VIARQRKDEKEERDLHPVQVPFFFLSLPEGAGDVAHFRFLLLFLAAF